MFVSEPEANKGLIISLLALCYFEAVPFDTWEKALELSWKIIIMHFKQGNIILYT